jgi:hypothetical protein
VSIVASRCAFCGSTDASRSGRREGKLWFCSQSCFLQYESRAGQRHGLKHRPLPAFANANRRRRGSRVRRAVRWVLIGVGLLVALSIVGAIVGGETGSKSDASRAAKRGASRSRPVPLHHVGGVWNGWRLRVLSVTPSAVQLLGHERQPIAAGGQEFMVSLAASYRGGGYGRVRDLVRRLYVDGSHGVYYSPDSGDLNCAARLPAASGSPMNETRALVFAGHSTRGHLCFQIAKNDAKTLALYVDRPGCNTSKRHDTCTRRVWFALR